MQWRTIAAVVLVLVSLFWPIRSEAQAQTISQSAERHKVVKLGMISGFALGAVGGGAIVHHVCTNNNPDFGMLCPVGVVSLFAGAGSLTGILTGLAVAPTVHGPAWKNILMGTVIGAAMGGIFAKAGYAHGRQIAWTLVGSAAQGAGTSAIISARRR